MAAPIPPKPAPTMTASYSSEVMSQTVPQVPETSTTGSALESSGSRRIQGGDAGHRAVALLPGFGRRIQHIQLHRIVGDRGGGIKTPPRAPPVFVLPHRGLPRGGAPPPQQPRGEPPRGPPG